MRDRVRASGQICWNADSHVGSPVDYCADRERRERRQRSLSITPGGRTRAVILEVRAAVSRRRRPAREKTITVQIGASMPVKRSAEVVGVVDRPVAKVSSRAPGYILHCGRNLLGFTDHLGPGVERAFHHGGITPGVNELLPRNLA